MKKYTWIFPLFFILALSYGRYTYILNPNFSGEALLLNYKVNIGSLGANSMVNTRSIIIYWILFFIGNAGFFYLLFSAREKLQVALIFYLIISLAAGGLILTDKFLVPSEALFSMGAVMKNFILSPMFTAITYIIIEYFHWFGKSA